MKINVSKLLMAITLVAGFSASAAENDGALPGVNLNDIRPGQDIVIRLIRGPGAEGMSVEELLRNPAVMEALRMSFAGDIGGGVGPRQRSGYRDAVPAASAETPTRAARPVVRQSWCQRWCSCFR